MATAMDDILSPFAVPPPGPVVGVSGPAGAVAPAPVAAPPPEQPLPPEEIAARGKVAGALDTLGGIAGHARDLPLVGGAADMVSELAPMGAQALRGSVPPPAVAPPPVVAEQPPAPIVTPQPPPAQQAQPKPAGPPAQSPMISQLSQDAAKIHEAKLRQVQAQADLAVDTQLAVAMENEKTRGEMAKQRELDAAKAQEIAEQAKKAADDKEASVQEFNRMRKRDPHADVSVGQTILAAIAQGLGAFGAAMTGTQNTAATIVARAAEMRVRKWERELDEAKEGVKLKDNRVDYFRRQGMDHDAASRAAIASLLDQGVEAVDGIKAQYASQEVQQRADAMKLGLGEERNRLMLAQAQAEQNARVKAWLASQPKPMSVRDQVTMRGLEVDVPQANGSKVRFYAKSEPEAKAIRDAQKIAAGVRSDLLTLESLIKGSPTLNPQTAQKVEILNNSIRKKYIKLDELGVPTGKDLELSSVVGDPTKWTQTTGQTQELIGRVRADMADRLQNAYNVQGFEGAP
jgi:hypothetical protein